eukprot:g6665.t1
MGNGVSWHDVRDMSPPELADFMLRVCDSSFGKHHQAIIDHAVGGGILCGLGEKPLRDFLADISITLKPQQDFIIQALEELRRNTEVAMAALDASGSPFKHTVVRNLRTHNAAYVTFTKEGNTFRGATKFAKSLRKIINAAWDPPSAPVTVRLRGSGTFGITPGPLLHEVAQSLNVIWLISDGSLEDPLCLMEVCAAVRQGTPVLPVRLAGDGTRPLNLPIWGYSIATKPPRTSAGATVKSGSSSNSTCRTTDAMPNATDSDRDVGGEQELDTGRGIDKTATERKERAARLRQRTADEFYTRLAQRLPKPIQAELHRNNFLVKDVIAAVRTCFESAEEAGVDPEHAFAGAVNARPDGANPPIFDLSAPPVDHETMLTALVGVNRRKKGEEGVAGVADRLERKEVTPLWNWEQIPRTAPLAGRARVNDAVPWRTEEETLELIRMEEAEADDLAGLLVKDMLSHPGSENHQWEGCRGLADLAARDSDGLSAVRRQGGIQAVLVALAACPKDADVQRWGCQALVPLFGDPVVAAPFRQAGVAAVVRALAVLQDVETALKSMGVGGAPGMASAGGGVGSGGRSKANVTREKWARAMKKIEVGRVKEQRRASLEKKEAAVRELEDQEAELEKKIEARRKSHELELFQDIKNDLASALAGTNASAASPPNTPGSPANPDIVHRLSYEGNTGNNGTSACNDESGNIHREPKHSKDGDEGGDDSDGVAALAEEQRRLEEQDRLEHEAEMARLKKIQEENKPDPWAMTDADIAVYDKAFIKQDKDKDGFISLQEAKSMFDKAHTSKEARRHIWELADPYQRGKLTQHGWRVAYHLARSTSKRKLQLPEALPQCLYPAGHAPVATPPLEGDDDASGVIEKSKNQTKKEVAGESKKCHTPAKDGAAVVKGFKVAAGTGKWKGQTKGEEEAKVGGVKESVIDDSKRKNKKRVKKGDVKGQAAGTKEKRRSVRGKAKSSMPNASSEEIHDRDVNAEYRMSKPQHARYNKMFDKITKRKSVQTIDGAEAAAILAKTGLSKADLGHLWAMADADRDGKLCRNEFAVAMHLAACASRKDGPPLPATLPQCLASTTATFAATASDEGGKGEVRGVEGRVIQIDEAKSIVSSLGYPEGLSDIGSGKGDVVGGTSDNTPLQENSCNMSQATAVPTMDSDAPDLRRDTPKVGNGDFGDTVANRKTSEKTMDDKEEGQEATAETGKEGDGRYAMSDQESVRYGKAFDKLVKGEGTKNLGGKEAAAILAKSGLGKAELGRLWAMSDADRDGALSRLEFSIAMHLASCSANKDLPSAAAANDSGGKKKKRSKTEMVGGDRETPPEREEVAVPGKESVSSAGNTQRAGYKLRIAKSSKEPEKQDISAAIARAAAVGGVVAESGSTENIAKGKDEDHGTGDEGGDGGDEEGGETQEGTTPKKKAKKKGLCGKEKDQLYAMSTSERAGYDVIFMQIDVDQSGTIDGREAAALLGKSGLTREQLKAVWKMADKDDKGELDHSEWAVAMHLCVAQKQLPLPDALPRSLGGPGQSAGSFDGDGGPPGGEGQHHQKGSKARREAEQARDEERVLARRAVKLREHTEAFRLGKLTAAAFYITLAQAFGSKRHTMIPKVARSLPLDKARALVAAAGLGEDVLVDDVATERKLQQLRRRRIDQVNLHVKSTTSGATARDVQLLACRLANRLSCTLDDESNGGGISGGGKAGAARGGGGLGDTASVAAQMASAGGAPARRCFADCCETIVAAAAGSLDENAASDSDGSGMRGRGGNETLSLHREGVRAAACQALAVLAKEPGLSRRLVAAGAGQAVTRAMKAAPRDYEVQLSSLETMAILTESNRGMWDDEDNGRMNDDSELTVTIDAPCRAAVHAIQTFVRDPNIHRAASQAVLALLVSDAAESAACSVAAAGGATALSRVLATSPTNGEVQLPAILAINELLERRCRRRSSSHSSSSAEIEEMTKQDSCGGEAPTTSIVAAKETLPEAEARQTVEHELVAAAGCELLCKSSKTFPQNRELRLGCLRAMGALCRGAPETAVDRLVDGGVCEQLMKVVEAFPGDTEVRRAGLTLLVGIAEYGDGTSGPSDDEKGGTGDGHGTLLTSSTAASGALVTRLGLVGAVSFAAAWLREATAPVWAWIGAGYGGGRSARKLQRAGCIALGNVAGCLKVKELQALGRKGGAQAVTAAFKACPGDKDVAFAGLLAVSKLSISSENRRLLGQAGACPLIAKELLEFSDDEAVAEEGCRAVSRIASLSGFNRTGLGLAGAAEATAAALLNHPSKPMVQRWGLSAAAALVAETDPSGNTDRITRAGILDLAVGALAKFRHNPTVQAEGLKTFGKVATSGEDGATAVWAAGVVLPTVRALGLYLNDANVQHWGCSTVRVLTGSDDKCEAWRGAGAPEAVVRALIAFDKDGTGRYARHDEEGLGRTSETRCCTDDESLCIQFQACAAALNLAASSPDARRRIVGEGAGEALASMMRNNSSNPAAQQGALATLAVLSSSGVENRKRLHRYRGGVPKAVVSALEAFPDDRRVRCEGVLTVQNLSLNAGGARAMIKAGAAPVIVRMLRGALMKEEERTLAAGTDETVDGDHLDRNVLVYLLNGLANMATANNSLSDFVGRHGACQAVVTALEQRPRDLQLQASGIKAVRALALGGGRNVEVLANVRGPTAIARAAGLFLRDREIQLACLGAEEILCRGGNHANRDALVAAGSVHLLESALLQFAGDSEVVSQGFRALVELVLLGENAKGEKLDAKHEEEEDKERRHRKSQVDESPSVGTVDLPRLNLIGESSTAVAELTRSCKDSGASGIDVANVSHAVETVLAALERNPCRELAKVRYAVKRALKINGTSEAGLVSRGGKILTLVAVASGRALAQ